MIDKICTTDDWDWPEEPFRLIPVSSKGPDRGFFEKSASFLDDGRLQLRPRDGYTPVFIFAMGSYEKHGSNKNADAWPTCGCEIPILRPRDNQHKIASIRSGLRERTGTFVTDGHVYRDHKNSDPALSKGDIHSASFNEKMGRAELIAWLKNDQWESELEKLASHKHTGASMSARVLGDYCSVCGNYATNRSEYCDHIRKMANMILDNGHQIVMLNNHPTFFDISGVERNADRIGYMISSIALDAPTKSAAIVVPQANPLREEKLLILKKLAAFESAINDIIEGRPVKQAGNLLPKAVETLDKKVLEDAAQSETKGLLESVLGEGLADEGAEVEMGSMLNPYDLYEKMRDEGIVLPPGALFKTIGRFSGADNPLENAVPGIYGRLLEDPNATEEAVSSNRFTPNYRGFIDYGIKKALFNSWYSKYSLEPEAVAYRAAIAGMRSSAPPQLHSVSKSAQEKLAREYVSYQLAALTGKNNRALFLTCLRNFL